MQASFRAAFLAALLLPPAAMAAGHMYWTDSGSDKIFRANLDGTGVIEVPIDPPLADTRAIALDRAGTKIYWNATGDLRRADFDGTDNEFVIDELFVVRGIGLDVPGGKVYWADSGDEGIWRANLDGTGREPIVTAGQAGPRRLALDLPGGKVYWTHFGPNRVERANLDGSGAETIASGFSGVPEGIALDLPAGKVYWSSSGTIRRANLDGTGEEVLTAPVGDVQGMAVDSAGGKLYWAMGENGPGPKIQRANLDGTGIEDLVTTGVVDPRDIALDIPASGILGAAVPSLRELGALWLGAVLVGVGIRYGVSRRSRSRFARA